MKKTNYIKYLIFKEWLPIIIVSLSALLIASLTYIFSVDLYCAGMSDNEMIYIPILCLVMTFVMSFVVFSYRFSTKRTDTYYQIPLKQGELKNIRFITGLVVIVSIITVSFIVPYLVLLIRYAAIPKIYVEQTNTIKEYSKNAFNIKMLPLVYLVLIALVSLEYFISCFIFSLCHKPVSAILLSISIHAMLAFTLFGGFNTIDTRSVSHNTVVHENLYNSSWTCFRYSPGITMVISLPELLYQKFVLLSVYDGGLLVYSNATMSLIVFIIQISLHGILGIVSLILLLLKKDDSGELCNKHGFVNSKLNPLFFVYMIPIIVTFASCDTVTNFIYYFFYVVFAAASYFLYALFIGSFKIPFRGYIWIIVMILALFTLPVILDFCTGVIRF